MTKNTVKNLVLCAMFLALAIMLPQFFGRVDWLGRKFLPMHLPVLLCGFICGWRYGMMCGVTAPLLASLIFGMPPLYPMATAMAFELMAYGLVAGIMWNVVRNKHPLWIYPALVTAMLSGRIVYAGVKMFLTLLGEAPYTFKLFVAGTIVEGIPGIILQIVLIPAIILVLRRAKLIGAKA